MAVLLNGKKTKSGPSLCVAKSSGSAEAWNAAGKQVANPVRIAIREGCRRQTQW